MFDLFRSRAKAVRYLLGALLLMVALSMVVTLIPGYGTGGSRQDNVVAEIGKEALTVHDVQQQMQSAMRSRSFPAAMASFYAQQLVDEMISARSLVYEAKRLGIQITDEDVARALRMSIPQLFPNGQFVGADAYAAMLQQQGLTIPEFDNQLREQLLMSRLSNLVADTVVATPDEVAQEFKHRNEKVKLSYVEVSPAKLKDQVNITPEMVKGYFETNRAEFRAPEKRSIAMLVIDEASVGRKIALSDADLRKIYDANKDVFRVPERVHVRHVLLKTSGKPKEDVPKIKARAEELLKEVKAGGNFAEIAKKNSEDPGSAAKGGDLGWIVRDQTVKAFENAAFTLKPNEISDLITTEYGFHVIQVLEKEPAHVRPFEEVKEQIATERKRQQVFDTMQRVADQAHDDLVKHPQEAAEIAARYDMTIEKADRVGRGDRVPEFGNNPDFNDAIAGLVRGGVTPVMQAPGNKLAIAVVSDIFPERPAELAEVEPRIRQRLTAQRLTDLVNQRSAEVAEKAKASGGDLKKVAQQMGLEVKGTQEFGADGAADGIGPAGVVAEGFQLPVGSVFGPVTAGQDSRFVCKVDTRTQADMSLLPAQRADIQAAIKGRKSRDRVQLFMDSIRTALIREGKVKVHKDVLERVVAGYHG